MSQPGGRKGDAPMRRLAPLPLLVAALLAMLAASWAGLLRLGWALPPLQATWVIDHGPLMISGFLGTLITLERAIALSGVTGSRVVFAAPLVAALGALVLLLGVAGPLPRLLAAAASLGLVAIFAVINRLQFNWSNAVMGLGALAWLAGNLLWLGGRPVFQVVPWWVAFLLLTIAGERLELARVLLIRRAAVVSFLASIGLILAGLLATLWQPAAGVRLAGLGLLALGLWLLRFDLARRTVRKRGLTRFMAMCLLPGYAWLALAGGLWFIWAERFTAGLLYDAMLHAVLLGFVFSMIFAHAPIILPAVTSRPMPYHPVFYGHLLLLHASLLARLVGDLAPSNALRQWGGTFNVLAVLLFLAVSAGAVLLGAVRNNTHTPEGQHAAL